jgi:Lrp/AsnC family transcriptional regulator for asnA, asnC and gidA
LYIKWWSPVTMNMRKLLYEKIDTIQGIAKTDSMIRLCL